MFGSTSSKSFRPIPHGFPGVASNINRPNSGWNVGNGSPSLARSAYAIASKNHNVPHHLLHLRHAAALLLQRFVFRQGIEDVGLSEGELDLLVLIVVGDDKIFNLEDCERCRAPREASLPRLPKVEHLVLSLLRVSIWKAVAISTISRRRADTVRGLVSHLDAPLANFVRCLLCLWPLEWGAKRSASVQQIVGFKVDLMLTIVP